jgi:hypothetical protein
MVIDHVVMLVPDAVWKTKELRDRHGLGSERGPYHPFAGTRNHSVPLTPPAYLEFLTIENREVAETTESGHRVLACEAAGFGLFAWSVLVGDLEAVSERLAIAILDYTIPHGDGTSARGEGHPGVASATTDGSSLVSEGLTLVAVLELGLQRPTGKSVRKLDACVLERAHDRLAGGSTHPSSRPLGAVRVEHADPDVAVVVAFKANVDVSFARVGLEQVKHQ